MGSSPRADTRLGHAPRTTLDGELELLVDRFSGRVTLMADHVYEKIEVVGSSTLGIEDAVKHAVAKLAETRHNLRWLEVVETRCHIENNQVAHWQVTVRVGVRLD